MLNGNFRVTFAHCGNIRKGDILNFVNGYSKKWFDEGRPANKNLVGSMEEFNTRYTTQIEAYSLTVKEEFLTVGRAVEMKNGRMYFILPDRLIAKDGWLELHTFDNDLKHVCNLNGFDIVEVYDAPITGIRAWNLGSTDKDLLISVWKREERTPQQIEIERIESEMRKLADELSKLKEANNG